MNPFSSSITLDENRAVLPPLLSRPHIYSYYDPKAAENREVKNVERDILVTWRKAWWAYGFKPVILGPADAKQNLAYEQYGKRKFSKVAEKEVLAWLAWGHMGGGILVNYLTLPMGEHEDPIFDYLRRNEFPQLTRFRDFTNGMYVGSKEAVATALANVFSASGIENINYIHDMFAEDKMGIDATPDSLAYYDSHILNEKYTKVWEAIQESPAKGLRALNLLMNAHLHNTWQNRFSGGIAVLKPIRKHMQATLEPAIELAERLAHCSESPMISSCPPNKLKTCKPCVAANTNKISTPPHFRNKTEIYTIGAVPHPWTLNTLQANTANLTIAYIRRETDRDVWIKELTKESLGTGVSTTPRLIQLKQMVASPYGSAHSLWFTAEKDIPDDLDWHFGFAIPKGRLDDGKSETPVPGPERRPQPVRDMRDGPIPSEDELEAELRLLQEAKAMGGTKEQGKQLKVIEAWNLADTEAWRFVGAFRARATMERKKWEEEESKLTGGVGAEK
jgi:hypothetical protein